MNVFVSSNDIIAFMDDDDYYYPNSLFNRVCHLITSKKTVYSVQLLVVLVLINLVVLLTVLLLNIL